MKNSKHALVALLAMLAAGSASAQSMTKDSGYYGEVGYTALKFNDAPETATPKLARFVIGKSINENLDFEGMASFTVSKDAVKDGDPGQKLSGQNFGIYAKPKTEVTKDTEIFGRIGVARTSWESTSSVRDTNDSFTRLAYGIGIQTQFTKDVYGQVDYMDFGKKDGVSAKGFTLSVGTRF